MNYTLATSVSELIYFVRESQINWVKLHSTSFERLGETPTLLQKHVTQSCITFQQKPAVVAVSQGRKDHY